MRLHRRDVSGFSLVELLAVVLVLAVIAAIAIPLYLNTRKTSAARTCKYSVAAMASAESNYATRFGRFNGDTANTVAWESTYTAATAVGVLPTGGLIGGPESLAEVPKCPLNNAHYSVTVDAGTGVCHILCPNASTHQTQTGAADTSSWDKTLPLPGNDTTNGL